MRPIFNQEAERAVLGSLILSDRALRDIRLILEPSDFYIESHRIIYSAMLEIEGPIDPVILHSHLRTRGMDDKVGGIMGISELVDGVATAQNIEYYARIVSEDAAKRRILEAGILISHVACKGLELSEIKEKTSGIFKGAIAAGGPMGMCIDAGSYVDDATNEAVNKEPVKGVVRTRLGRLDSEYGGLYPGIPYLLAARTSMGKSVTALNIIIEACMSGRRVVLFSFEETKRIVTWRLLSRLAQVPLARIFKRNLSENERREIQHASAIIKSFNLLIIDRSMSSQRIIDICEQENERDKVNLVVVDLLGKVREDPKLFGYQKLTLTSNNISQLPGLIDAPVLALHQINRAVEKGDGDKMPQMSNLRDSGTLEEDFKTIMLLLRPWYYDKTKDPNEMAMSIVKNANGPVGTLKLWCELSVMTVKAAVNEEGY